MDSKFVRRLAAEAVGTLLLVLFGAGSVVAALTFGQGELDYAGLGFISLTFGIVIAVVIYGFGAVSGAHLNPAVTFGLAVSRRFSWVEVVPYVLAQLVGAVVGALLIVAVFGQAGVDLGLGMTSLGPDVSFGRGIVIEAIGTFLLMFTIMAVAVDPRAPAGWAGLMIGLAVVAAILLIGPQTGGSLNPARTFGPDLVAAIWGNEDVEWGQLLVYWVGPLLGSAAAALLYDFVAEPRAAAAVQDEASATTSDDA